MKYDIGSDLHVDINARVGVPKFSEMKNDGSDTIVLAGDLANNPELAVKVLAMAASVYKNVIFVDGNHEHYNGRDTIASIADNMDYFSEAARLIPNVTYLTGDNHIIIDGVMFVGANAWYNFTFSPPMYSIDAVRNDWNTWSDAISSNFDKMPDVYANEQASLIAQVVADAQDNLDVKKIVVVTHTVPNINGIQVKNNPSWDRCNAYFGSSKMAKVWAADVNRKIIHAVCGHTHTRNDFIDCDGIRFVINPRGYHFAPTEHCDRWFLAQLDTDDDRP